MSNPSRPGQDAMLLFRAARYAHFPNVRREDVCARFGISRDTLRRATKELGLACRPTLHDFLLHALTRGGTEREGPLPELASLADYLDYVNKDGGRAEDVTRILGELVRDGMLAVDGPRWRLVGEFP